MSRVRGYAFTLNNWMQSDVDMLMALRFSHLIFAKEIAPTTNTPHLQGSIVFKSPKTLLAAIRSLPRCHVTECRNINASIEYCKKSGEYEEHGEYRNRAAGVAAAREARAEKNKRLLEGNLRELVYSGELSVMSVGQIKKARVILDSELGPYDHDDVRGIWYCGPPDSGKSRTARANWPVRYDKPQNKWFDGYAGEECILLDDLDTDKLGHHLKIWSDRYACSAETKFGKVQLRHKVFVVTSNYTIADLFTDAQMCAAIKRRFKVTHFHLPLSQASSSSLRVLRSENHLALE